MLKIFIGPNGFGKTYELKKFKKSLFNEDNNRKDVIMLESELVYADDLKGSMGSSQKLHFLLRLIEKSNKQYIFLDEPENHSHPSMLHITANLINKLSKTKDVYIATHSPELLNMLNINFDNLFLMMLSIKKLKRLTL